MSQNSLNDYFSKKLKKRKGGIISIIQVLEGLSFEMEEL